MPLTHVFFDVHDVLIDGRQLAGCYAAGVGRVLAARYGGSADAWAEANRQVFADWDSYYTDLNLSGDEGMRDYYEGMFRTTRALFRLTGTPEPPFDELQALSRELPGQVTQGCRALYPEVRPALEGLRALGLTLGVISSAPEGQIRSSLEPVLDLFDGWISGADTADRFDKDEGRYAAAALRSAAAPASCLIVDDKAFAVGAARRAGWFSVHCVRAAGASGTPAHTVVHDLLELIPLCQTLIR
ncbi:MAG: hypothetical protein L6Q98_07510 [Anaerolineae bacterium]|nr:hypothetical protein [Anaerolineae bacterium]NUQ04648.1 HAD hydrolase-like protein [Anaerolineae bacterium]